MSQTIKHGYWPMRGIGQISRLLLAYTGAQWEDVKHGEEWHAKEKQSIGFDFPNLPYIIDGDFKLTESSAVQRYIIERSDKKDLLGKDIKDRAIVNEVIGVLGDIRSPMVTLFFDKEYESKKAATLEKVTPKLEQLSKFVGEKDFALGYLTLVDFLLSETANYIKALYPEESKKYPFIERIHQNFNKLPEIENYYKSETAVKGPFLPQSAVIKV